MSIISVINSDAKTGLPVVREWLASLNKLPGAFSNHEYIAEEIESALSTSPEEYDLFVAKYQGKIEGMMLLEKREPRQKGTVLPRSEEGYIVISSLLSSPLNHQKKIKGVGFSLIQRAVEECINKKLNGILVNALEGSEIFYSKCGFIETEELEDEDEEIDQSYYDYVLTVDKIIETFNQLSKKAA